jgi:hypothetical protein
VNRTNVRSELSHLRYRTFEFSYQKSIVFTENSKLNSCRVIYVKRPRAKVCGRSPAEIAGSKPAGGFDV